MEFLIIADARNIILKKKKAAANRDKRKKPKAHRQTRANFFSLIISLAFLLCENET